jgi:protein CMS1
MPTGKKRAREGDDGSRKNQKRRQMDEDHLDTILGINKSIALMDSQLLSDYLGQNTRRFGTDLSPVELGDLAVPGEQNRPSRPLLHEVLRPKNP